MVSTIMITIFAAAGVAAIVGITQTDQLQETFKPSASKCEFAGQRLSEDYYCVYRSDVGNGQRYLDVEKISENQIPPCGSVKIESVRIDVKGIGEVVVSKDSNCSDTLKVITVNGVGQVSPNQVLDAGQTRISIPFNLGFNSGTTLKEGATVSVAISMQNGSSSVRQTVVLPLGQVQQKSSTSQISEQNTSEVTYSVDAEDIQPWQRIFVRELYNDDVSLPTYTGIHTSYAKSVSIAASGNTHVKVSLEGSETLCIIEGTTFDKMCDVPSNSDITLYIDGVGQTHVVLRVHFLL